MSISWNSTREKKIGRFIIVVEFHDAMGGMLVKLNDAIIKRIDEEQAIAQCL